MTPRTPQERRQLADECERLAAEAALPEARETLLRLASRWRALADEDEMRLRPRKRKTESAMPA